MTKMEKVHCNSCSHITHHELLYKDGSDWVEELSVDMTIEGGDVYELLRCKGCDSIVFRHTNWFSEDTDKHGRPVRNVTVYPPTTYRKEPRWLSEVMWMAEAYCPVRNLIGEIYVALQNDAPRLATMGIRALLDMVMIDKTGDHGSFSSNLAEFEAAGFVSEHQRKIIESVLEIGHATIHRGYVPHKNHVGLLMDITESIIESIYVNTYRAEAFAEIRLPARGEKKMPQSDEEK